MSKTAPTVFDNIIEEDKARLAAANLDNDPDFAEVDGVEENSTEHVLVAAELTKAADVPYFTATDSLGRDLETKIAEAEQRLREIAGDIDSAKATRDHLVDYAKNHRSAMSVIIDKQCDDVIHLADNAYLNEVSVLRGRETDIIKALSGLKGVLESIQRR